MRNKTKDIIINISAGILMVPVIALFIYDIIIIRQFFVDRTKLTRFDSLCLPITVILLAIRNGDLRMKLLKQIKLLIKNDTKFLISLLFCEIPLPMSFYFIFSNNIRKSEVIGLSAVCIFWFVFYTIYIATTLYEGDEDEKRR